MSHYWPCCDNVVSQEIAIHFTRNNRNNYEKVKFKYIRQPRSQQLLWGVLLKNMWTSYCDQSRPGAALCIVCIAHIHKGIPYTNEIWKSIPNYYVPKLKFTLLCLCSLFYCMTMTLHRLGELFHPYRYIDHSQHHMTITLYTCTIANESHYVQTVTSHHRN